LAAMFHPSDPRNALGTTTGSRGRSTSSDHFRAGAPQFFALAGLRPSVSMRGVRQWVVRTQNFIVLYSEMSAGAEIALTRRTWESMVVVPRAGDRITVTTESGATESVVGKAVVVAPPANESVSAVTDAVVIEVVSYAAIADAPAALNDDYYRSRRHAIAELVPRPVPSLGEKLRAYNVDDFEPEPGRFGRIFASGDLMINVLEVQHGPRDTNRLSPHEHDDFEQCSIAIRGSYVHHLRTPWTPRLDDWREDEHRRLDSPSLVVIPPRITHTSQAVGDGIHELIDVFGPIRPDFAAQPGWVLNATDAGLATVPGDGG